MGRDVAGAFLVTAILTALAEAPVVHTAEPGPTWTVTLDAEVSWPWVTISGVLVVATPNGLFGIDGASGRTLWKIDDLRQPANLRLDALRAPYVVLQLKRGMRGDTTRVVIDVNSGREAWNSATLGLNQVDRQFYVPSIDALLLTGRIGKEHVAVVADLETGHQLHTLEATAEGKRVDFLNPSVLDTDSTLVVANGTVLTRYNLATGKVLWTSRRVEAGPRKPCPSRAEALSGQQPSQRSDPRPLPPEISLWVSKDGRRIFATHGSTLYAVSVVEGHLLWPYPAVLCGGSAQLLEADGDVIAWTMPLDSGNDELVRLDGETGNVRWQYPAVPKGAGGFLKAFVTPDAPLSNAVVSEGSVYTLLERTIVRIDLATGISTKIGKTRVEESVGSPWLEEFQTGFLVVGQQDIEWLTREGKSTRHVHYDPVSGQGGALITLGVGAALQAAGPFQIGNRMVSIGPDYRALAGTFMHEFHASSRLDSIRIMLADLDEAGIEGPALVAIDCRTGNVLRRIPASKNPRYAIDRVRARVFIADNKTIRCYNL